MAENKNKCEPGLWSVEKLTGGVWVEIAKGISHEDASRISKETGFDISKCEYIRISISIVDACSSINDEVKK